MARLTESDLVRLVKRVIKEQGIGTPGNAGVKIIGTPEQFLRNSSTTVNKSLGIPRASLKSPFNYYVNDNSPSSFGVGSGEIEKYMDYLGIYGKVPGTGIPIPYQGDDLNQMKYFLRGDRVATNAGVYGRVEDRTTEENGLVFPAVEKIRA
jgi:hypothetical protein